MPQSSTLTVSPLMAQACQEAGALTREELIGVAVARGCQHYASFVSAALAVNRASVKHEVLGCALLRGPLDLDTFLAFRVGAMVLSDENNSPGVMAEAAEAFGVVARLAHLATVALAANDRPAFWRSVLTHVPEAARPGQGEVRFLPGSSRLCLESPMTGLGRPSLCRWLRTNYQTPCR